MAGVTHTKKGFKLSDAAKFKGDNLTLEFTYEMSGDAGYDPKAGYFEKFRAYFAQEAAAKWNKAKVKAEAKMKGKFDACDKEFGKYIKDIKKYNILNPEKTKKEKENEYTVKLSEEMRNLIQKDIGPTFIQDAHSAAEKRLQKEGTKLSKSKAQIAFSIGKVVVKLGSIAAAATV